MAGVTLTFEGLIEHARPTRAIAMCAQGDGSGRVVPIDEEFSLEGLTDEDISARLQAGHIFVSLAHFLEVGEIREASMEGFDLTD